MMGTGICLNSPDGGNGEVRKVIKALRRELGTEKTRLTKRASRHRADVAIEREKLDGEKKKVEAALEEAASARVEIEGTARLLALADQLVIVAMESRRLGVGNQRELERAVSSYAALRSADGEKTE